VLILFQLVDDEILEGFGFEWGGELTIADFLYRSFLLDHVLSSRLRDVLALMFPVMSLFTGLKAAEPRRSKDSSVSRFQKT
jgi:hypothetical protein